MASKRVISIEVNENATKIIEAEARARNPKVYKTFMVNTPAGAVQDGIVQPTEAYVEALHEEFIKQGIKTNRVVFSISSTKIASREVTVPYVKESKVGDVIQAKAEEFFPVDLSDYKVSHTLLGDVEDDKGQKKRKALVLAAPTSLLKGYYDLADALGLTVVALDYSGNSLLQAVRKNCDEGVQAVAKIDENSTMVIIMRDGAVVSIRNIAYGVNDAIQIIKGKGRRLIGSDESDDYKNALADMRENIYIREDDGSRKLDVRVTEVTASLESLVNGIARVLTFYNSRSGDYTIEHLHLTGVGGSFRGMHDFLQGRLGLPVSTIKSVEELTLPRGFYAKSLGDYIAAIGAMINPLDFTMSERKEQQERGKVAAVKDYMPIAVVVAGGSVILALALALIAYIPYRGALKEQRRIANRIEELKPVENIYNTYIAAKGIWTDAEAMYALTLNHNDDLVAFIQELEQKMPSDIIVLSMVATGTDVTMDIQVTSKESAARVLQELDAFQSIEVTNTTGLTDARDSLDAHVVSFSVKCIYANSQEAASEETAASGAATSEEGTAPEETQAAVEE